MMSEAVAHTRECLEHQVYVHKMQAMITVWKARWLDYCPHCHGAGRFDDSDPSVGIYYSYMDCPVCVEQGVCSRCGEMALPLYNKEDPEEGYTGPCGVCGFNFGEPGGTPDDYPPDLSGWPDCICSTIEYWEN